MQAPAVRRQACLNAPRHRARSPLTQAPARRQDPHHPAPDATRTRTRTPPGPPRGLRSALTSSGEGQHAPRVAEGPLAAGEREGGEARLSPSVTRDARPAARRVACRPQWRTPNVFLMMRRSARRVATYAAEDAKSHGSRLRRGAALPSNPRARWVTQGRQRPLRQNPGSALVFLTGTSSRRSAFSAAWRLAIALACLLASVHLTGAPRARKSAPRARARRRMGVPAGNPNARGARGAFSDKTQAALRQGKDFSSALNTKVDLSKVRWLLRPSPGGTGRAGALGRARQGACAPRARVRACVRAFGGGALRKQTRTQSSLPRQQNGRRFARALPRRPAVAGPGAYFRGAGCVMGCGWGWSGDDP